MTLLYDRFDSPLGPLTVAASERGIAHVLFEHSVRRPAGEPGWRHAPDALAGARAQLQAWLAGDRQQFDLPLDLHGTAFQLGVWQVLARLPYASTTSYRDVAVAIGQPAAFRAVGMAVGRNPVPLLLPCHRVLASGGGLGGFSGGLAIKRQLLALEQVRR